MLSLFSLEILKTYAKDRNVLRKTLYVFKDKSMRFVIKNISIQKKEKKSIIIELYRYITIIFVQNYQRHDHSIMTKLFKKGNRKKTSPINHKCERIKF